MMSLVMDVYRTPLYRVKDLCIKARNWESLRHLSSVAEEGHRLWWDGEGSFPAAVSGLEFPKEEKWLTYDSTSLRYLLARIHCLQLLEI